MTESEFRGQLSHQICEMAKLFLDYYNPCHLKEGECLKGNPGWRCCSHTRFKNSGENPYCPYLGEKGCTHINPECRVFLCDVAKKTLSDCTKGMNLLEELSKIYDYFE